MYNRLVVGIFTLFAILAFWMSLIVPPFETPDEPFHYAFARHISAGNWLPVQQVDEEQPWSHEGSQAPLYYLLVGTITSAIDQSDFPELAVRNPRANIGNPLAPGNKNFMLYSGSAPALRGANLALHLGRWFSILLAMLTLWFTWLTARLALPNAPELQLAVLLLVAVIPQFVYVSASFTNDNMVIVLGSATLYFLAMFVDQYERAQAVSLWQWIGLGVLLGLAALSKLSGLGLVLLTGLVLWVLAIYYRDWTLPWRAFLPVSISFLIIAGWWYWRNYTLYGDWLGANYLLEINGRRTDELTIQALWAEFRGLRYSFWGLFGWFNVPLPEWSYVAFDSVAFVALLGLLGHSISALITGHKEGVSEGTCPTNRPVLYVLAAWSIIQLCLIAYWAQQATSSQGRLIFPALGAFAILFAVGLNYWLRLLVKWININRLVVVIGQAVTPIFALACTFYVLIFLMPTTYAAPMPIMDLPVDTTLLNIRYGDQGKGHTEFTLLGISLGGNHEVAHKRFTVGERIPITLYWRAEQSPTIDHQIFVQLLDETGNAIANVTTHPGWGRNPTTLWQAGKIYADHYEVMIDGPIDNIAPLVARVYVGIIDPATNQTTRQPIIAYDEANDAIQPMVAQVVVVAPAKLKPTDIAELTLLSPPPIFGDKIELVGYIIPQQRDITNDTVEVSLLWRAKATVKEDFVAYVHFLDAEGKHIAGFDQPPVGKRFPTSFWQHDDMILGRFTLTVPSEYTLGSYRIWTGLYKADGDGAQRISITDSSTLETAHNQLLLGEISKE